MRKFILWISLSIFLGIGTVALFTMGSGDASAVPKKKGYHCPPGMPRVSIDEITDDNTSLYLRKSLNLGYQQEL